VRETRRRGVREREVDRDSDEAGRGRVTRGRY